MGASDLKQCLLMNTLQGEVVYAWCCSLLFISNFNTIGIDCRSVYLGRNANNNYTHGND